MTFDFTFFIIIRRRAIIECALVIMKPLYRMRAPMCYIYLCHSLSKFFIVAVYDITFAIIVFLRHVAYTFLIISLLLV